MFKKNQIIDNFQLYVLGVMMGNALFVGMGNIITVKIAQQDTWIVGLASIVVGLIPIFLICKIMNYNPDVDLIQKIRNLLGKKIGFVINLFVALLIFGILVLDIWGISVFASIKYLSETPMMFVTFLFLLPVLYSAIKGIEAIGRTTMILFYIGVFCHVIVTYSLVQFVDIENIKPIMVNGLSPIIEAILKFLAYSIAPMVTLLIIPKNKIKNNKYTTLSITLGYISAAVMMSIVFFMSMSTVGYEIATMYRYPEYFIVKKATIGSAFDNIENFFSVVWIYNMVVCSMMSFYYVREYLSDLIKWNDQKKRNIIAIVLAVITLYVSNHIFTNDTMLNNFMRNIYPVTIALPLFVIMLILVFIIMLRRHKKKA